MEHCKTCKYWCPERCSKETYGLCGEIGWGDSMFTKDTSFLEVFAGDDQGLEVELVTRQDFGCTRHSPN